MSYRRNLLKKKIEILHVQYLSTPALLTRTRQVVCALITLIISSYCCWQIKAFYMFCFSNLYIYKNTVFNWSVYLQLKPQLSARSSLTWTQKDSTILVVQLVPISVVQHKYLTLPRRRAWHLLLKLHNLICLIHLVQIVTRYLNTPSKTVSPRLAIAWLGERSIRWLCSCSFWSGFSNN